ncbi:MAG TPA: ABC transporter ATP-binding protein [Saprospiraceae bacterium]|nr:ABC transporter ATP-binding protein [Saprospiraceae bacterium]MCB9328511.1 ABC transporter ATP-binding protein [Lewinellaceae bacterium]HPQ22074.1 ABC transporter ATP-binding protein [Saprospiraceae bacterium]HRX28542.1 ABC transporter ATP-binding protein [Saprospiraceae bacterium]
MIIAKNITKSYNDLKILKGIDIQINQAEIVSIMGKSGAGKSTLLHILGTLDKADSGTLEIDGQNLGNKSDKELSIFRNQKLGFVFQFHHLLAEFTALENVIIPALISGTSKKTAEKTAMEVLERLEISKRAQHKPSEMSGGEQQRVAIARALINNPAVIFADEPTGNLDHESSDAFHKLLKDLNKDLGQTFVIVTHNKDLANLSDRVIHIQDGLLLD